MSNLQQQLVQCAYDIGLIPVIKCSWQFWRRLSIDQQCGPCLFLEGCLGKFFIRKKKNKFHKPRFAVHATFLQGWNKLIWGNGTCEINTNILPSKIWMLYMSVFLQQPLYFHTTNEWVLNCHSEAVWGYFPAESLAKASWNSVCILQLISGNC